jgi:hypothetical protein
MNKTLLLFSFLLLMVRNEAITQSMLSPYSTKKLITVPVTADSTATEDFCICKIISFNSDNNQPRTDAIFAGSSPEKRVSKKQLLRNIDYELHQALVFFDSYKLVKQVASAVDCNSLYKYLKEKQEIINRSTFLSPTYASFQY